MPGFNGTGPQGQGAMTGRGRGMCGQGRTGYGAGFGTGRGRGLGQGRGFGLRAGFAQAPVAPTTDLDDQDAVTNRVQQLEQELEILRAKLESK